MPTAYCLAAFYGSTHTCADSGADSTLVYYYVWPTAQTSSEATHESESGTPTPTQMVDTLERLAALLGQGALTSAEFAQAKKRVLASAVIDR